MTSTAYIPVVVDDHNEVDCVVEYEVIGFYRLNIVSIKAAEDAPDILPAVSKDSLYNVEADICRRLEWKKEPRYRGDN